MRDERRRWGREMGMGDGDGRWGWEMGMGDESRVKSEERMNDEDCTFSELSM
jgi:hypothetical protein